MDNKCNIPKIIHYCWFGRAPIPEFAQKCINSWKLYCPDYEIRLWNEDNFDLNICSYVEEAYKKKKWAFVSDYARFWILYNYGGVYFDTDVEMIRSIDDILSICGFMAFEADGRFNVAPGLGMAAEKGTPLYKEVLDYYKSIHFVDASGNLNLMPVGEHVTKLLVSHGLKKNNKNQFIDGIAIYSTEYFCPKDVRSGALIITNNTHTIHHYSATWLTFVEKYYRRVEGKYLEQGGIQYKLIRIYTAPLRLLNKIITNGIANTFKYIIRCFCASSKKNS